MSNKSNWALYVEEREGLQVLEKGYGFVCYKINGEECFIQAIFIRKENRLKKMGTNLMDEISEIAKKEGCKFMTATITKFDSDATSSLRAALAYGFKLADANNGTILITKKIEV